MKLRTPLVINNMARITRLWTRIVVSIILLSSISRAEPVIEQIELKGILLREEWMKRVHEQIEERAERGADEPILVVYRQSFVSTDDDFLLMITPVTSREADPFEAAKDEADLQRVRVTVRSLFERETPQSRTREMPSMGLIQATLDSSVAVCNRAKDARDAKLAEPAGEFSDGSSYHIFSVNRVDGELDFSRYLGASLQINSKVDENFKFVELVEKLRRSME